MLHLLLSYITSSSFEHTDMLLYVYGCYFSLLVLFFLFSVAFIIVLLLSSGYAVSGRSRKTIIHTHTHTGTRVKRHNAAVTKFCRFHRDLFLTFCQQHPSIFMKHHIFELILLYYALCSLYALIACVHLHEPEYIVPYFDLVGF